MSETLSIIVASSMLIFVLILLLLTVTSAFFHFSQMVAFVPTPKVITDAMIDLADIKQGETVIDLGAGDGRVLARTMERFPGIHAIGYEGAFGVWLLAIFRGFFSRFKPTMRCQNFLHQDLSEADVVFTYLSIAMMQKLKPKFEKELKKGARVVSHAFSMQGITPDKTTSVTMPLFGKTNVFLYRY